VKDKADRFLADFWLARGEKVQSKEAGSNPGGAAGAEMQVSPVVDHRILDGADAARFLARLRELLQDPHWMAGGG
jgi:pyruvate/2-oxoglutarate dehydrogenase complex dihydrolipoamide acyltransferase (E2) component